MWCHSMFKPLRPIPTHSILCKRQNYDRLAVIKNYNFFLTDTQTHRHCNWLTDRLGLGAELLKIPTHRLLTILKKILSVYALDLTFSWPFILLFLSFSVHFGNGATICKIERFTVSRKRDFKDHFYYNSNYLVRLTCTMWCAMCDLWYVTFRLDLL